MQQEVANVIVAGRKLGAKFPSYIVAELSANHNQSLDEAIRLVRVAAECGVDAVKLQTYTPDTITINCDKEVFRIGKGTIWEGKSLYQLYGEAFTPWEWYPKLQSVAEDAGVTLFSTPFDPTAVDFLETMGVPAYKVASFELVDLPFIRRIASTGKPIIMSTGMASLEEIDEAVTAAREAGCRELVLLKCTSAYPSLPEEMNLRTIPDMCARFRVPVGLSDHTLGIAVPVAAVTMGACIIEKHFTLSRAVPGPDSIFSLEPHEFKAMVDAIRMAEKAMGTISYRFTEHEAASRALRRSLFVVKDVRAGEPFTEENVRSIRPGHGLPPKYLTAIVGRIAVREIPRGTPFGWDLVAPPSKP